MKRFSIIKSSPFNNRTLYSTLHHTNRCSKSTTVDYSNQTNTHKLYSLLQSCTHLDHLKKAHAKILVHGLQKELLLASKLAILYILLAHMEPAHLVFNKIPNPSSYLWNLMIRGYATQGQFQQSIQLYSHMIEMGFKPDKYAFPFAIKSSAGLSDLQRGKQLHQHVICYGCSRDLYVNAALVDMYAKCGCVDHARQVFDKMSHRDLVLWTSMISGYVHNGYNSETLEFFDLMRHENVKPNRVSFLSVLLACGHLGALRIGEWFHGYIIQIGFDSDILVATTLVNMYSNCGDLDTARYLFDRTSNKDVVCWSAMIACYGSHGRGSKAIDVFNWMMNTSMKPNHVTFTCILSACSHSGLLEDGLRYFESISKDCGIMPKLNHYTCVVDLLARAGKLSEAVAFIESMPIEPDANVWGALLGGCRMYGNVELGEAAADQIFKLEPTHAGYHVLLSNIYADKSRWVDVERVRELMVERGADKIQGFSLIELDNRVHKFGIRDRLHPQSDDIYSLLEQLTAPMRHLGYVPLTDSFT